MAKTGPRPKKLTEKTVEGLPVGRDKTIVPPDEVQKLAALGCKNIDIAKFYGVTIDSINRNFASELTKGREMLKQTLRQAMLHNACVNMNAATQIFLAKNMLGMSDNGEVDTEDTQPLPWKD